MEKHINRIAIVLLLLFATSMATAAAASLAERKAEVRQKTASTLERLYKEQPSAKSAIAKSAGYAVFNNTGFKLGILGSAHGRGMAVNTTTGQEVFMRMQEYQAGIGLGIKEYAIVFVFYTEEAWHSFVDNGWKFGGQATAAADDGSTGGTLEGALQIAPSIWIYQMTTKGLAAELAVKGTNYYRDKDFDSQP